MAMTACYSIENVSFLASEAVINITRYADLRIFESSGASDAVQTLGYSHPSFSSSVNGDLFLKNKKASTKKANPPDTMKGLGSKGSSHPMPPSEFPDPSPNHLLQEPFHRKCNEGITLEEFTAAWSEAINNRFKNLDINNGGATGKEELGMSRNLTGDPRDPRGYR